jgi:putative DNA primase/helicase
MVPVAFDPAAKCPRWKSCLREVCGGDRDLIRYLRRAVGYTLTANTDEQVFFMINGPGGTGKGAFVNTIREMLGELGQNTPFATFLAKHFEPIPADLAALKGARMVVASESNPNQQIDEAKIKAFTGGDPITARFLYQNFFTFKPTGKLWLVTNDLPQVRSTSDAFWRRARVIPFPIKVAKRRVDKQLGEKLRAELPGILAWAVRGCLAWQKHGLGTCAAVKAATKTWREGADHLGRFVRDCLVLDGKGKISSSEMFSRYQAWCADHGEQALSIKALKVRLTEFDLTHKRVSDGSEWRGARFRRT